MKNYIKLTRFDKPIGILLLLWPTLSAVWLASHGRPSLHILFVFVVGVVLMRAAGCAINDYADRKIDGHVARTRTRVIVVGAVTPTAALMVAGVLALLAFLLVLTCNRLTIELAVVGALLAGIYPFLKRVTHLPQLGLGLAFAWGVPMAFAAVQGRVPAQAWGLFAAFALWPVIYDTMYALADVEDDRKVGVKSTAILFGRFADYIIGLLYIPFVMLLFMIGYQFNLNMGYFIAIFIVMIFIRYQQKLLMVKHPDAYFAAFTSSRWIGLLVFLGIVIGMI